MEKFILETLNKYPKKRINLKFRETFLYKFLSKL